MLHPATQGSLSGRVVGISDGDTFTLLTDDHVQVKIRLHGIDAPEKKQDFGQRAKQALSDLIFSKDVTIVDKGRDRYGRTIGMVYVDNRNVNEEMLIRGMAWHYLKYDHDPHWDALEAQARAEKRGLWSQPAPVAPWEWRAARKHAQAGESSYLFLPSCIYENPSPSVAATDRSLVHPGAGEQGTRFSTGHP